MHFLKNLNFQFAKTMKNNFQILKENCLFGDLRWNNFFCCLNMHFCVVY